MAKAGKNKEERLTFGKKEPRSHPIWSLAFLVLAILSAVALWDYDWLQNPDFQDPVASQNKVGAVGLFIAANSLALLGRAAWVLPCFAFWMSGMLMIKQSGKLHAARFISWIGLLVSIPVLFDLWLTYLRENDPAFRIDENYYRFGYGGWIGRSLYQDLLHKSLGSLGSLVVFGVLFMSSLIYAFCDNVGLILHRISMWILAHLGRFGEAVSEQLSRYREKQRERAEERARIAALKAEEKAREEARRKAEAEKARAALASKPKPVAPPVKKDSRQALPNAAAPETRLISPEELPVLPQQKAVPQPPPPPPQQVRTVSLRAEPSAPVPPSQPLADEAPKAQGLKILQAEQTRKAVIAEPQSKGDYTFPHLSLLAEPPPPPPCDDENTHQEVADQLVQTLAEFGVRVTMGEVHPGPVITRYDLYPAAGVRVEKIQNLDKNLALALRALSVRILAPVPGKGCVGVEIPNKSPQSVYIRDILESEDWVKSKAEIPVALGKEVSGKPLVADLTKMPHMLIAGSTGSGKTVCINAIVASLLYKMSPEDVRFVMVDPKIVEMQVYNALPHMLIPVVTEPKKVPGALKYLINEMERRYRMFAKEGVRNIAGFNAKRSRDKEAEAKARELELSLSPEERAAAAQASASIEVARELDFEEGGDVPDKLPYIVCIIDELADLMMVAQADVETGIARLAQLARAAGIHLIIATQRPSVNVITGIIKANLPSRIAFKVASKVDSRTILDTGGADQLIGRGDMLFLPPGIAELVRSQGAFVADEEINGIVKFVNEQNGEPEFDEQFQRSVEESDDGSGDGGDDDDEEGGDELLQDAIEVLRSTKRASTSMLQRRLRIGYNRAARIMEILEDRGYVGPENGSMPREILRDLDEF
ncbi:MAG: DNA translocase FtsK [Opitutales bacterium]|nr:DNA translocase FtsK [Opitutales bacterium]